MNDDSREYHEEGTFKVIKGMFHLAREAHGQGGGF
jgi:hypothetical protein